jgi:hypothetical protein
MPIMPLSVYVKSDATQTAYDIHNFNPDVRASQNSKVGPRYNYIVLSEGKYDGPTSVRVFMNYDEVLALYDKLTPIVETFRAQMAPPIVAVAPENTECSQSAPV